MILNALTVKSVLIAGNTITTQLTQATTAEMSMISTMLFTCVLKSMPPKLKFFSTENSRHFATFLCTRAESAEIRRISTNKWNKHETTVNCYYVE